MSSYHSSFNYNGENSFTDKGLIVVSVEPDDGFKETFLSMDVISDNYYDGSKKYNYGSKYNTQATVSITVIRHDGNDITLRDFRSCAKWLTGTRVDSWLDLYNGDKFQYSFLGRVTNMEQYKLDARTAGLRITFSSVSPWAYSAPQYFDCAIGQVFTVDQNGMLLKEDADAPLMSVHDSVLSPNGDSGSYFNITGDGIAYIDTAYRTIIDNQTDDLYTYINLDIDYINENSSEVSIKNLTLNEETIIKDMSDNEVISLSAKQFIISNIPNKIFGDSFNFVWPRLAPGKNELVIYASQKGVAQFTYRYPMKVGDCTMDVSTYGSEIECCDTLPAYDTVRWEDIVNTPSSIYGYGITDAYNKDDIDAKFKNIDFSGGAESGSGSGDGCDCDGTVDEDALNQMLSDILG